jgi:phenylacetate-coenzyme A ligase PaaK-like adenylate-forming protein
MNILRQHGVIDPMFFKVTTDFERTAQLLRAYDPDILISVPSVLKRCVGALKSVYDGHAGLARKILYIGEPMEDALRIELQELFNAECYSFYGTTEVGSVCIECPAHTGMHIPLELFVPTIHPWPNPEAECAVGPSRYRGVVAWTSLGIRDQPVVKYAVKDLVDIDLTPCECGSPSPRLTFHHRVDEAFFLYGITFTYQFFLEIIENSLDQLVQLEIRVVHNGTNKPDNPDLVLLTMDESFRSSENQLRTAVTSIHPVSELVWSNLLQVQFEFVGSSQFERRKGRRVQVVGGSIVAPRE